MPPSRIDFAFIMASSSRQAASDSEAAVKELALYKAAGAGNINEVTRLLGKKADINYVHRYVVEGKERARTPLMAVRKGHAEVAKFLITRKANVNLAEPCNGQTALQIAAAEGNLTMIELLVLKGAMHLRDKNGLSPLHVAANFGHKEAVNCLLDQGADINAVSCAGFTALHNAALQGCVPMIEQLISKGARHDVRDKDGVTPLQMATLGGRKEAMICLLDHGADINAPNNEGMTALHSAVVHGHLDVFKYLVEKGANLNQAEDEGYVALHFATQEGYLEVVKCLVDKGADLNLADVSGNAALYYAAKSGHLDIVKFLVLKGADLTKGAWTPLEVAIYQGHDEVSDFLVKAGARFEEFGTAMRQCKSCGKIDDKNMKCRGCEVVHYCSVDCQKEDRKAHKVQCESIKAKMAAYKEHMTKAAKERTDIDDLNARLVENELRRQGLA